VADILVSAFLNTTKKSTVGHIIFLGTSPISWASFLAKTTVSLSTAEAEYISSF
jgi:hypothetical protein